MPEKVDCNLRKAVEVEVVVGRLDEDVKQLELSLRSEEAVGKRMTTTPSVWIVQVHEDPSGWVDGPKADKRRVSCGVQLESDQTKSMLGICTPLNAVPLEDS
ncbi:MAG: hypothetical protein M1817_000632 [Caeruleum heppii]|nr:MAG: hypothetical protein M1817_000632 [Caeruleum heppii]